ncbi:MAG: hypothetical protein NDJ90_02610 [Oligoflexia bacterium]|nr:hypothetical protein [Oligoflexia bacterium]
MAQAGQIFESAKNAVSNKLSESKPTEGRLTEKIEQQTAKIPSLGYLGLAVGSMAASALLAVFSNKKEYANFVGLWAPSFLLLGIYNKLVKIESSSLSTFSKAS